MRSITPLRRSAQNEHSRLRACLFERKRSVPDDEGTRSICGTFRMTRQFSLWRGLTEEFNRCYKLSRIENKLGRGTVSHCSKPSRRAQNGLTVLQQSAPRADGSPGVANMTILILKSGDLTVVTNAWTADDYRGQGADHFTIADTMRNRRT